MCEVRYGMDGWEDKKEGRDDGVICAWIAGVAAASVPNLGIATHTHKQTQTQQQRVSGHRQMQEIREEKEK